MRRTPLRRKSFLSSSKHRIRPVNPKAKSNRQKRRPKVTPAIARKIREMAGHQCTATMLTAPMEWGHVSGYAVVVRCPNTEDLEVHHEHYKQTPEDPLNGLKLLCKYHHHQIEQALRPWNFR